MARTDPIFKLPVPLIFAHRGGAREAPESTVAAFLHALRNRADVLEVDLQMTSDGKPVVWHGPKLDIAFDSNGNYRPEQKIGDLTWQEIETELWVRHPNPPPGENEKLQSPDRRIMSLGQFLDFVKAVKRGDHGEDLRSKPFHLNVELKKTKHPAPKWTEKNVDGMPGPYPYLRQVLRTLKDNPPPDLTIVVASVEHGILKRFRQIQNDTYVTNLSKSEQFAYCWYFRPIILKTIGSLLGLIWARKKRDLSRHAFETAGALITEKLVRHVHTRGGGIYAILTKFPFVSELEPEGRTDVGSPSYRAALEKLVDTGIDGVMTDYPSVVSGILKPWP